MGLNETLVSGLQRYFDAGKRQVFNRCPIDKGTNRRGVKTENDIKTRQICIIEIMKTIRNTYS